MQVYTIDRFEGRVAVMENETREFTEIPKSLLPENAQEGDKVAYQKGSYILVNSDNERKRIRDKMNRLFEE